MMKHAKIVLWSIASWLPAAAALAQETTGGSDESPKTDGGSGSQGFNLSNPLKSPDITAFLQDILEVIMVLAVPLIVFMIIYAGFMYVMVQGNETKITTASRALLYAVIGGVIILGAQVILAIISGTVNEFQS